jgi:hypothetical protein
MPKNSAIFFLLQAFVRPAKRNRPLPIVTVNRHACSVIVDKLMQLGPRLLHSTAFPEEIQNLKIEDRGTATVDTTEFGSLSLASFVCHKAASANFDGLHQMHLVANGRTVTTRKIDGLVGIGRFGPGEDRVFFLKRSAHIFNVT